MSMSVPFNDVIDAFVDSFGIGGIHTFYDALSDVSCNVMLYREYKNVPTRLVFVFSDIMSHDLLKNCPEDMQSNAFFKSIAMSYITDCLYDPKVGKRFKHMTMNEKVEFLQKFNCSHSYWHSNDQFIVEVSASIASSLAIVFSMNSRSRNAYPKEPNFDEMN